MQLKDKIVLLTGASSGIGRELAGLLSKECAGMALLARSSVKLLNIEKELKQINSNIKSYKCDVSNHNSVRTAVSSIIAGFGKIDIAILNAGINYNMRQGDFDSEDAEEIIDINLFGMVYFFEELIPEFRKNGKGMFVGVSSIADVRGFPGYGFYSASKAAATIFLESMRGELKPNNIKVLTVRPGFVNTPINENAKFKMPFLMQAEKAAGIILRGIKKEKTMIQFPWQTVLGGKILKLLPGSVFDFVALMHRNKYYK